VFRLPCPAQSRTFQPPSWGERGASSIVASNPNPASHRRQHINTSSSPVMGFGPHVQDHLTLLHTTDDSDELVNELSLCASPFRISLGSGPVQTYVFRICAVASLAHPPTVASELSSSLSVSPYMARAAECKTSSNNIMSVVPSDPMTRTWKAADEEPVRLSASYQRTIDGPARDCSVSHWQNAHLNSFL